MGENEKVFINDPKGYLYPITLEELMPVYNLVIIRSGHIVWRQGLKYQMYCEII